VTSSVSVNAGLPLCYPPFEVVPVSVEVEVAVPAR
jgi:hypothetical protein